jgi:hypothetical protein
VTEAELCDYWRTLRARVAAMAAADTERLIFGAHSAAWGHGYGILPPVPEKQVGRFESRNRLQLPPAYRTFLTHYGSGGAGPGYGIADFSRAVAPHDFTVPFSDTVALEGVHSGGPREGLGYLGTAGCGSDSYIELNGAQPGTVWCSGAGDGAFYSCEDFQTWMERWASRVEQATAIIVQFRDLTRRHAAGALTLARAVSVLGPQISRRPVGDGTWTVRFASGGGALRCDEVGAVLDVVGPRKGGIGS